MTTVTVIGAGAIGGTIAALLSRGGEDVTVVDTDADHIGAIRSRGLTIEGPDGSFTATPGALLWQEVNDLGDLVLIAVKAQYTDDVLDRIVPMLRDDTLVVTLQNGLCCLQVADRVGRHRTLAALVNLFADYLEPGKVKYYYPGEFEIGELRGGTTGRIGEVAQVLRHWGPVIVSPNLEGLLWTKLGNAAMLAATAMVDTRIDDAVNRARALMIAIAAETYAVAEAEGIRLEPLPYFDPGQLVAAARDRNHSDTSCLDGYVVEFREHAKPRSGIWRDIVVRRRKTEVGPQLGFVVERGARHGVPTPLTARLITMVEELEDGRREMGWDNLSELNQTLPVPGRLDVP